MNILSFAATNSRASINKALVTHAARRFKAEFAPEAEVQFIDLNDFEMPIYSIDREADSGIPTAAQDLFAKIGAADALLISFAEHNGSVTSAWKNTFDWMSRIEMKLFQDKPMVILAATPGPRAGAGVLGHLEMSIPFFGGQLKSVVGFGTWGDAWDHDTQTLSNPDDAKRLGDALATLLPTNS